MAEKTLLVIVPMYGHAAYAAKAARSALAAEHPSVRTDVLIIDDASPDDALKHPDLILLRNEFDGSRCPMIRLRSNVGLTRVWNMGLRLAQSGKYDFACCTNSDVIFSKNWFVAVESALRFSCDLVGPLTNAPGVKLHQAVQKHRPYVMGANPDKPEVVDAVGADLFAQYAFKTQLNLINGFCMTAKTETWLEYAYDIGDVFKPVNLVNSKGDRNPTPTMTLNEDELQGRWTRAGLKIAVALGSFVFHYRAVSRGDKYKTPGAFRPVPGDSC